MEEEKRIVINTCKSLQPGSHQQTVPTHSEAIVIGGGKGYNTWLLFTRPNRAFSSNRFRNVIVFHFFFVFYVINHLQWFVALMSKKPCSGGIRPLGLLLRSWTSLICRITKQQNSYNMLDIIFLFVHKVT